MGRRKIEIEPIKHERNRSVTFLKRKAGLFKKAYELGVLCSVDIAVIVFDQKTGQEVKLYEYCSGNSRSLVQRFQKFTGEREVKGPSDYSGEEATGAGDDDDGDADAEMDDGAEEVAVATSTASQGKGVSGSSARRKAYSDPDQSPPRTGSTHSSSPPISNPALDTGPSPDVRSRASRPMKRARLASSSTESSAYPSRSEYEHSAASYRPIAPAPLTHSYSDMPPTSGLYGAGNFYGASSSSSSFSHDFVRAGRSEYESMLQPRAWSPPLPLGLHGQFAHGPGNTYGTQHEAFDWPVHQPRM